MSRKIAEGEHCDNLSPESLDVNNITLYNCHNDKEHESDIAIIIADKDASSPQHPTGDVKNQNECHESKQKLSINESEKGARNLDQMDSLEPLASAANHSDGKCNSIEYLSETHIHLC